MSKVKCIGIIAEDDSDFESTRTLIKRIAKKDNIPFKKSVSGGCGKLQRKAFDYAKDLHRRGCDLLILFHDRDKKDLEALKRNLNEIMARTPFSKQLICIPVEEIEAWFLSDPDGVKKALSLKRAPKISGLPENILSPKEKLEELVFTCSEKEKRYINTKHNRIIAENVSIEILKTRCPSFKVLYDFIHLQAY